VYFACLRSGGEVQIRKLEPVRMRSPFIGKAKRSALNITSCIPADFAPSKIEPAGRLPIMQNTNHDKYKRLTPV